mmetsp:Transcript_8950/g.20470  ORF Transcript_8950/g.20470 Transcript_8950/m.20470 type:complete len:267 (+) Transcript_8950:1136-1936(+)
MVAGAREAGEQGAGQAGREPDKICCASSGRHHPWQSHAELLPRHQRKSPDRERGYVAEPAMPPVPQKPAQLEALPMLSTPHLHQQPGQHSPPWTARRYRHHRPPRGSCWSPAGGTDSLAAQLLPDAAQDAPRHVLRPDYFLLRLRLGRGPGRQAGPLRAPQEEMLQHPRSRLHARRKLRRRLLPRSRAGRPLLGLPEGARAGPERAGLCLLASSGPGGRHLDGSPRFPTQLARAFLAAQGHLHELAPSWRSLPNRPRRLESPADEG